MSKKILFKKKIFFLLKKKRKKKEMSIEKPIRWDFFESLRDSYYNSLLFMISYDKISTVYLYNAKRVENTLIEPYIEISSVELNDLQKQSRLSDFLLNTFCGVKITHEGKNVISNIIALPDRKFVLKMKKEKQKVVASITINITKFQHGNKLYDLQIENAEIYNVNISEIINSVIGTITDIASITLNVRVAFQEIANALRKQGVTTFEYKPTTVFYLTEQIAITPELKARFNPTELFRIYTKSNSTTTPNIVENSKKTN